MANDYNGAVSWGIVPLNFSNSNLATMSYKYRGNYLMSANDQIRYQVQWLKSNLRESQEAGSAGDIINVIFKIETSVGNGNYKTIAVIKKARDIVNRKYNDGTAPVLHRFTIDVGQLVADQLSYSLCPINKGTWQSNFYGGLNGGLTMQDNVIGGSLPTGTPVSEYNISENGTYRQLRVSATFEIFNSVGQIVTSKGGLRAAPIISVINSVNQFEKDIVYNARYVVDYSTNYKFLSRCPNWIGSVGKDYFKKPVRVDEAAEWLQFYIRRSFSDNIRTGVDDVVGAMAIKIVTTESDGSNNTFYLRDFEDNLTTAVSNYYTIPSDYQKQMFIQNISPLYINSSGNVWQPDNARVQAPNSNYPYWNSYTGDKITNNTIYYTASLVKIGMWSPYAEKVVSYDYKYTIDRESENIPYGFVRFHWLNSLGGTDSYTAKRNVVEGLTISKDVVERKSGDRTWYQANSGAQNSLEVGVLDDAYISDTMRGGDIYKGGREVLRVNADRVQSVYTEPLNKSVAKWLEELVLSPNVWVEMQTDATYMGFERNPYLHPSKKDYIPVIITNSDIETVNQENGLVKFNIEYTLSHKVETQRN